MQWFKVDLGSAQSFNKLTMDAGSSVNDYPRGFDVYVSSDNTNWTLVVSGTGTGPVTTITFAMQTARYVKIQINTNALSFWWSIHEFTLYN